MQTLTEFLLARLAEDEQLAENAEDGMYALDDYPPSVSRVDGLERFRAEIVAKRRIVEWHLNWPVLTQSEPKITEVTNTGDPTDPDAMSMRMSQRIEWLTEQEYRTKFGDEPPTSPILRMLAQPYADHPDFDETWAP